jgi:hypothetical protein
MLAGPPQSEGARSPWQELCPTEGIGPPPGDGTLGDSGDVRRGGNPFPELPSTKAISRKIALTPGAGEDILPRAPRVEGLSERRAMPSGTRCSQRRTAMRTQRASHTVMKALSPREAANRSRSHWWRVSAAHATG